MLPLKLEVSTPLMPANAAPDFTASDKPPSTLLVPAPLAKAAPVVTPLKAEVIIDDASAIPALDAAVLICLSMALASIAMLKPAAPAPTAAPIVEAILLASVLLTIPTDKEFASP